MYINGCVPYRTKKEKLRAFRDLKREFGESVKIVFKDNLMVYSVKVNRYTYL
jgi:hypothetical protein